MLLTLYSCCGCGTQSREARLERLFCSELVAELLQRTGIMRKDYITDETTPGDFHQGREGKWISKEYSYGKMTYYSPNV